MRRSRTPTRGPAGAGSFNLWLDMMDAAEEPRAVLRVLPGDLGDLAALLARPMDDPTVELDIARIRDKILSGEWDYASHERRLQGVNLADQARGAMADRARARGLRLATHADAAKDITRRKDGQED